MTVSCTGTVGTEVGAFVGVLVGDELGDAVGAAVSGSRKDIGRHDVAADSPRQPSTQPHPHESLQVAALVASD